MQHRSALDKVRHLGSTHSGAEHWWSERVTAIALVPLSLWFVYSAIGLTGADLAEFKAWIGLYGNPVLLILFIFCMFHHGHLGVQVVIEDYVHNEQVKFLAIISTKFVAVLFGTASAFAVLQLTFRM